MIVDPTWHEWWRYQVMTLKAALIWVAFVLLVGAIGIGALRLIARRRNAVISQAEFNARLKQIDGKKDE